MRRHTASKDTAVAAHGRRKAPIASKSVRYDIRWKRNTQVAGHPCPAHLGGQDARSEELALGATCGSREVRAESGVARGGGALDVQGQTQRVVRVHFSARSGAAKRGDRCAP